MQIKRPRDLKLRELPRIESPAFAPGKVQLGSHPAGPSLNDALSLADDFSSSLGRSDSDRLKQLKSKLSDGSLVLIKDITERRPFSPLIAWQDGGDLPGRWVVTQHVFGLNLETQVAHLNDWQITPEQIKHLGPGGVGHLSANSFQIDLKVRQAAEREQVGRDSQKDLSLPLGAAASVAPVANQAGESSGEEAIQKKLHIEVGIFLDGTGNNSNNIELFNEQLEKTCLAPYKNDDIDENECRHRLALMMGTSYANGETNVSKLFRLYRENRKETAAEIQQSFRVYSDGVGTKTGGSDSLASSASGLGDLGIINQLHRAFDETADLIAGSSGDSTVDLLSIDLFGFSRGAAAARHAAFEISKDSAGMLGQAFKKRQINWPKTVSIRFVGLFDTVAGIVNPANGDWSAGDDKTAPITLYLDHNKIKKAVQFSAADECRRTFALNSLRDSSGKTPDNFIEISLPGAHSDIGGGYHDYEIEKVQLTHTLSISDHRTKWPEETTEWDNLMALKEATLDENWIGAQSLDDRSAGAPFLDIKKSYRADPPPYGQVDLKLEMTRALRGGYSRIPLHLMHSIALDDGIPFNNSDLLKEDGDIPEELSSIHRKISEGITSRVPTILSDTDKIRLKQRYLHHSDNFNMLEFMVGQEIIKLEIPWETAMPFTPAADRRRIIHPNTPERS